MCAHGREIKVHLTGGDPGFTEQDGRDEDGLWGSLSHKAEEDQEPPFK